jgi:hypothetical protein
VRLQKCTLICPHAADPQRCHFAHSLEELRRPPTAPSRKHIACPEDTKGKKRLGTCKRYRSYCAFGHHACKHRPVGDLVDLAELPAAEVRRGADQQQHTCGVVIQPGVLSSLPATGSQGRNPLRAGQGPLPPGVPDRPSLSARVRVCTATPTLPIYLPAAPARRSRVVSCRHRSFLVQEAKRRASTEPLHPLSWDALLAAPDADYSAALQDWQVRASRQLAR